MDAHSFCKMHGFKTIGLPLAFFAAMLILLTGCGDDDRDGSAEVRLSAETVNSNPTTVRIITWGDATDFAARIVGQSGDEVWCSFAPFDSPAGAVLSASGKVGVPLSLYLLENQTDADRTATLAVEFGSGASRLLTLTQLAWSPTPDYDRRWGEQPLYRDGDSYIYKTYYTTLQRGGYVRNYSVCFDRDLRVSHWVAYPLTANYVEPMVSRTNAWSYDPNDQLPEIAEAWQSDVSKTYGTGDARGHQCPSADRYSNRATNAMTFYATNIMPQNYDFNGGIWASLEKKVRDNMQLHRQDTIFVVTGAHFTGRTIRDRDGKTVGYPSNCWKVLLRSSGGRSVWESSADELHAIGFWFANDRSNSSSLRDHATSIADIERKTGFTFFRNIPAGAAAAVKAQNEPSDWGL